LSAMEPEESVAFAFLVYFYNGRHDVRYNWRILCARVAPALGEYSNELKFKMPREFHWSPYFFFPFGATASIWALAYIHETLRFDNYGIFGVYFQM
jgi:hypothetical protein